MRLWIAVLAIGCSTGTTSVAPTASDGGVDVATDAEPDRRCAVPAGATVAAALPRDGLRCTRYPFKLAAPRDVVETASGAIYVTEMSAGRVSRLEPSGFVTVATGLSAPIGIRERDGKLIVSEEGAHALTAIDPRTGEKQNLARDLGNVTYLAIGKDNAIYASSFTALDAPTAVIKRVAPEVTSFITGVNVPEGLLFDGDALFVVEWGRPSRVSRFAPGAPPAIVATGFDRAYGIASSGKGLYVSDTIANTVTHVAPDGAREEVLRDAATPAGLFRTAAGDLLVVEHGNPSHNGVGALIRLSGF